METQAINLNILGTKAQSKSELYRLLTVEAGLYLPPQDQANLDFVSDICFGDKKAFKSSEVNLCTVPHVDGLRSENLITFIVEACGERTTYLRTGTKLHLTEPSWGIFVSLEITNTATGNILNYELFQRKIKKVLESREKKLLESQNLSINIKSDIAAALERSSMVSGTQHLISVLLVPKGKSHKLLRKNLLRKQKMAEEVKENQIKEAAEASENLKKEVEDLQYKLKEQEKVLQDHLEDSELLKKLYEQGVIDKDDSPITMS